jgi:SPP1 gp7 family putative phage head morphogenesis protein
MALPRDNAIQAKLGDLLAHHMAAANLLGRTQVVKEVHRKTGIVVPIATSSRFRGQRSIARFAEDDDSDLSAGFSLSLPADNAADYLRGLTPVTKDTFDGLSAQYKRDAFTVAGVSDQRLIQKIRDQLADVMAKGGTRDDFEAAARKLTSDAGVEQIAAFTLDTVFTTNMQKAYSLGRYEQQQQPEVMAALPYGQYLTVGDDRVRPEHAVIDGFIARLTDPVWNKIYPPNGFNCRCMRILLLAKEVPEGYPADEPGMLRLPALAMALVPTPGFLKVFPIAA